MSCVIFAFNCGKRSKDNDTALRTTGKYENLTPDAAAEALTALRSLITSSNTISSQ